MIIIVNKIGMKCWCFYLKLLYLLLVRDDQSNVTQDRRWMVIVNLIAWL